MDTGSLQRCKTRCHALHYIVMPGKAPNESGGLLRGYQMPGRLLRHVEGQVRGSNFTEFSTVRTRKLAKEANAAAWLGHHAKLSVLVEHVAKVSRKMYKAPEFFYYALADGLRWLFVCHGKWRGSGASREPEGDYQMEFEFLTG